jgi:uncharacterized protein YhjY with autotransporter beta-barrel domain
VVVHYLDLSLVLNRVQSNLPAYGLTGITCPAFPNQTCLLNGGNGFLIYGDLLHPTSQGSAIIARYVATQLQAPLTLRGTSEIGLLTARQFGRTLMSRANVAQPADADRAEGLRVFLAGDSFSREVNEDSATDEFNVDGGGATGGVAFGFASGVVGVAVNYSRPQARFSRDTSETRSRSWQIGAFGSTSFGPLVGHAYLGYGNDEHEIERQGVIDNLEADADGSHLLAGAKAGYLMPMGGLSIGPVVGLDYAKAKVKEYTEKGDAALTLNAQSSSAEELTGSLGVELRSANGASRFSPFAAVAIEKNFAGDGRAMRFSQTSAPAIVNRWDLDERSKKPYGRASIGGSAAIVGGVSLNALLSSTFGRDDGDDASVHFGLGLRF